MTGQIPSLGLLVKFWARKVNGNTKDNFKLCEQKSAKQKQSVERGKDNQRGRRNLETQKCQKPRKKKLRKWGSQCQSLPTG